MRSILRILLIIFIILVVVGGVVYLRRNGFLGGGQSTTEAPLNINLQEIKPASWEPYTDQLLRVDIDTDDEDEWMLLYRYDNGPLGGVIYDAQPTPRGDESVPIPDRPSAYLVPYYLLPDYQQHKANGYLGDDPRNGLGAATLDYREIVVNPEAETVKPERLIVLGQTGDRINRLSIFWWISNDLGYGGAHASTPGWLSLSPDKPNDWEAWTAGEKTNGPNITKVWAWEPQADRSNVCRRTLWELQDGANPITDRRFIASNSSDLVFCSGVTPPADPAYPEAQVLAYLLDGNRQRLSNPDDSAIPVFQGVTVQTITYPGNVDQAIVNGAQPTDPIQVTVDTDFTEGNGSPHLYTWYVTMIPPKTIKESVHWRISSVVAR